MCLLRHTFTDSRGSKLMQNSEELQQQRNILQSRTNSPIFLLLIIYLSRALWRLVWAFGSAHKKRLHLSQALNSDPLLPLYGENIRKIFPRSCNWACTLKNPCCRGWKISWGRLLLNILLGRALRILYYLVHLLLTCRLVFEIPVPPLGPLRKCLPLVVLHISILTPISHPPLCGRNQALSPRIRKLIPSKTLRVQNTVINISIGVKEV